jgi:NagD protein
MVLGETRSYSFEAVTTAIRLIRDGARFVATNPDPTGPSGAGVLPPTGSVAAAHSEATVMIGDRMDTDIVRALRCCSVVLFTLRAMLRRKSGP